MSDVEHADSEEPNAEETLRLLSPPGEEKRSASFAIRWTARACGFSQLVMGLVAIAGLVAFLGETADEPLRYQYLMAPILIWMVSVTILFASVLVVARSESKLSLFDQLFFQLGSSVPTIAMIGVLFTPAIG